MGQPLRSQTHAAQAGAAIAYAIELLRSGRCDWVLAGGADGFSKLTFAGFASLGAVSDGPCAPLAIQSV